jgi:hypothetical protein
MYFFGNQLNDYIDNYKNYYQIFLRVYDLEHCFRLFNPNKYTEKLRWENTKKALENNEYEKLYRNSQKNSTFFCKFVFNDSIRYQEFTKISFSKIPYKDSVNTFLFQKNYSYNQSIPYYSKKGSYEVTFTNEIGRKYILKKPLELQKENGVYIVYISPNDLKLHEGKEFKAKERTIYGKVINTGFNPVKDVTVTIQYQNGKSISTTTDINGNYDLEYDENLEISYINVAAIGMVSLSKFFHKKFPKIKIAYFLN